MNEEVAALLREYAELTQITGGDVFRVLLDVARRTADEMVGALTPISQRCTYAGSRCALGLGPGQHAVRRRHRAARLAHPG